MFDIMGKYHKYNKIKVKAIFCNYIYCLLNIKFCISYKTKIKSTMYYNN